MNKVYGFTNEFVAAYPEIYDFDNAFKNKDNVNINKLKKF
mgnify:CR=1 FL=1